MFTILGWTIIGSLVGHPVVGLAVGLGLVVLNSRTPAAELARARRRARRFGR